MSQERFEINKYNFSRRVVDHRYPPDFFNKINKTPLSPGWMLATRNWLIGGLVSRLSLTLASGSIIFSIVALEINSYIRENDYEFAQSVLTRGRLPTSISYQFNFNNQLANKGQWNNNFQCWQNDANCGRDF